MTATGKMRSMTRDNIYDAIVIGSGLGGLAAALKLSLEGAEVLLLERHNLPGGFATSFVRGRFEFEVSLHELSDVGPPEKKGAVRRILEDELGMDVEFLPVPEAYHLILGDEGINLKLPFGVGNFVETIAAKFASSREALTAFMADCKEVARALSYIGSAGKTPDLSVLTSDYPAFVATAGYTVDEVVDRYNLPDSVRQVIYPYWCYLGVPTSRLSFTIFAVMLYSYLSRGAYIPKLTSHGLSTAMEMRLRELGAEIHYNTRVDKILVEGGRAIGVETARGEKFRAPFIVTNLSPHLVYGSMISPQSAVPEEALKNTAARRLGTSALVLYLGLDRSPEELNLTSYGYFVGPNMDTTRAYNGFFTIEPQDMQAIICLNNANPHCSPPGTTVLSSTTLVGPEIWDGVAPEDYFALKERIAAGMIEKMSHYLDAPLADHIEEIEIATPQTFARYTGAYRGAMYGYEQDPWDSVTARSMSAPGERYIRGLEFAGGFASMGHGYAPSLISGRMAAVSVQRQLKKLHSANTSSRDNGGV